MQEETTQAPEGEITQQEADTITSACIEQLRVSRDNKRARLAQIKESEDLYFGIVPKSLRNPFNESFPYMSGFVDHLLAKIDDPPRAEYTAQNVEDYKIAKKYTALYQKEANSNLPNASWAKKDRWAKKLAVFSGVGIFAFFTESYPEYKNHLYVVDYIDFHFEPGGGGDLESHLFCGQDFIFKTREELEAGARDEYYDPIQTKEVIQAIPQSEHKDSMDTQQERYNRHRAFGFDPVSNNYIKQEAVKLVQWFTTYKGERYYVLFEETTQKWIRIKKWKDICSSGLWPYVVWQTNEEAAMLMAKAPADDARPIAKTLNRLLNQELYNREKINTGQRLYDPEMIEDVEALVENRIDALIPANTFRGSRSLDRAMKNVIQTPLTNTLDLVGFLDAFSGQKMGSTPGSQGTAEKDKKVGIFFGELKQVEERLGLYNKSYKEAWAQIAMRLAQNAKDHITTEVKIQLLGPDGAEEDTITPAEATKDIEFDVKITGGTDEMDKEQAENEAKIAVLPTLQTVNPRWRDEEMLRLKGYKPDQIRDAFNPLPPATMELLAEAAQAMKEIVKGKTPKMNLGANLAFIEYIIKKTIDLDVDPDVKGRLYDYASAHEQIAAQNEARMASKLLAENNLEPRQPSALPSNNELFNQPEPQPIA